MDDILAVRFVLKLSRTMARRHAVKLGIPAMVVAALAVVALWRIGPPAEQSSEVRTSGEGAAKAVAVPLTAITELLSNNAVGREASLEHVYIREQAGARTFWIGSGDERPVFVVIDEDVKRSTPADLVAGERATLIGIVRPVPKAAEAASRWHVTPATATLIEQSGSYLHVTEIRP